LIPRLIRFHCQRLSCRRTPYCPTILRFCQNYQHQVAFNRSHRPDHPLGPATNGLFAGSTLRWTACLPIAAQSHSIQLPGSCEAIAKPFSTRMPVMSPCPVAGCIPGSGRSALHRTAQDDPIWWFYVFWLPQYLSDARGFSLKRIALFAWIPFVAADLGNFTGGLVSGYCIRRGISVIGARKWVCAISCLPILAGIPAARVHNAYSALALICVALWGYASWSTMGLTLPSDLFPQDVVATVTGLSGFAAGLAGAVFTFAVGFFVDRFSYGPAFLAAGLLPIFATACLFLLISSPIAKSQ
jgi:Major Facilitator Superfamily